MKGGGGDLIDITITSKTWLRYKVSSHTDYITPVKRGDVILLYSNWSILNSNVEEVHKQLENHSSYLYLTSSPGSPPPLFLF